MCGPTGVDFVGKAFSGLGRFSRCRCTGGAGGVATGTVPFRSRLSQGSLLVTASDRYCLWSRFGAVGLTVAIVDLSSLKSLEISPPQGTRLDFDGGIWNVTCTSPFRFQSEYCQDCAGPTYSAVVVCRRRSPAYRAGCLGAVIRRMGPVSEWRAGRPSPSRDGHRAARIPCRYGRI